MKICLTYHVYGMCKLGLYSRFKKKEEYKNFIKCNLFKVYECLGIYFFNICHFQNIDKDLHKLELNLCFFEVL